uniref:Nucleolin 2 n=1 Tax=Noccaea caerulescens TaxID=107243 RepID=A0A1J3EGT6_NOCCA
MDESANKVIRNQTGMKLKGCDAAVPEPKARDIGRIMVTGFGGRDRREDVESALREHFGSCGKITDVYIMSVSVALIYFVGDGAVDKALKLDGSVVAAGGWKVGVKPHPFHDDNPTLVSVRGYDTSLGDSEIEFAVRMFFSSCGEVVDVTVFKDKGVGTARIKGIDAAEKALELNGSCIGRNKADVRVVSKPPRHTTHTRFAGYRRRPGRIPHPDLPAASSMTAE